MVAAAAVPGGKGRVELALALREEGERGEGVGELAGWVQTSQRREKGRGAVGRSDTASPWRFDGGPRRARTGWRRVAMSRSFRETPEARRGLGRDAWPAALANAVVTARTEREV